ncbi:hypothetical protein HK096_011157 [Nowakowskiella sp. JEL0078]|nr:hypothetical protein HK096_011157 [Nowakowskiella sp. JEL0078]
MKAEHKGVNIYSVVVVGVLAVFVASQLWGYTLNPLEIFKQSILESSNKTQQTKRFSHNEFNSHFGISHISISKIDPSIEKYIRSHDLKQDDVYKVSPQHAENFSNLFADILENGIPDDDQKGYGLFAKVDIKPKQVVAVYAGLITNNSVSDYQWTYPSNIDDENGNPLNLGIDSKSIGNWARFVNHSDDPNVVSLFVPYKGVWCT